VKILSNESGKYLMRYRENPENDIG